MDVTPAFEEDRRPSHVKAWTAKLRREGKQGKDGPEPLSASYVYACHARLAQIMSDAVHDVIIPRSPCSRRTSPGQGQQRPYVATTEQLWALHDIVPERIRAAILLGALAGLRLAEACALRASDVDFMRGIIYPRVQYPAEPLKTDISKTPIPHLQDSHPCRPVPGAAAGRAREEVAGRDGAGRRRRRPPQPVGARTCHSHRPQEGGRPALDLPLPRPQALSLCFIFVSR